MATNMDDAASEYQNRASQSGDKLVKRYTARTDKLARSTSPAAQKSYEDAMKDPTVLARRSKNLSKLTEADLNEAMAASGAAIYNQKTAQAGGKWKENTAPYIAVIDAEVSKLPARTRDAVANVTNRVVPIVKALAEKKKRDG